MAYGAAYPSQALTHSYSGRGGYTTPRTPAPFYDDYSRYPYGEPTYDDYVSDYAGRGDVCSLTLFVVQDILITKLCHIGLWLELSLVQPIKQSLWRYWYFSQKSLIEPDDFLSIWWFGFEPTFLLLWKRSWLRYSVHDSVFRGWSGDAIEITARIVRLLPASN